MKLVKLDSSLFDRETDRCGRACMVYLLLSIYLAFGMGVYFGHYYPIYANYYANDWKEGTCTVTHIEDANSYVLYHTRLEVGDRTYQAFGCGSYWARARIDWILQPGKYSWDYQNCEDVKMCSNMEFMPIWYCDWCKDCDDAVTDGTQSCSYLLHKGNSDINEIEDLPDGYSIDFPTEYSSYIQIILDKDEPFFDWGGWLCATLLWTFMVMAPAVSLMIIFTIGLFTKAW